MEIRRMQVGLLKKTKNNLQLKIRNYELRKYIISKEILINPY